MPTATASLHDQRRAEYLFDHYSSSFAAVPSSLYIIILFPALVIQPVFVRDIHLIPSQLTEIVYCVIIYGFGGQ